MLINCILQPNMLQNMLFTFHFPHLFSLIHPVKAYITVCTVIEEQQAIPINEGLKEKTSTADNTLILCSSASLPDAEQHMKISKRQNCSIYSHFTQYPFSSLGYINPEPQFFLLA